MFREEGGQTYALPSCADPFFQKYLDVFDEVRVIGIPAREYLDSNALVKMTDSRISVRISKPNTSPSDFKNDNEVKRVLREEIEKAEAILIKPSSRRGIMAIKIAEKLHKPYMIEMTGDIHNALKQHPSLLKRLYAPVLYRQIKNAIRNCKFGLYVSKDYLQQQYPIEGVMCGCSDVIIEPREENILENRIKLIETMKSRKIINIALIGFYQGKMKGVDTAIRAMAQLPNRFHLNILGNGTEDNRNGWYRYAKSIGMQDYKDRINFPKPIPNSQKVLEWLDTQDFLILPTLSEGLCRCMVEAISRGCVCFATNICSMPELLPLKCLHPIRDDKTLANMLLSASNNLDEMRNMARENFEHAKEYEFDKLRNRRIGFLKSFELYCKSLL